MVNRVLKSTSVPSCCKLIICHLRCGVLLSCTDVLLVSSLLIWLLLPSLNVWCIRIRKKFVTSFGHRKKFLSFKMNRIGAIANEFKKDCCTIVMLSVRASILCCLMVRVNLQCAVCAGAAISFTANSCESPVGAVLTRMLCLLIPV